MYTFFNRKWFFDKIYNEILTQNTLTIAYEHGYQNIDRGVIELIGPNGIWQLFSPIANKLNFGFNFHLDTPKKLRNFFKILFITFVFIYLFIFGTWYFTAYEIYIQLWFKGYAIYEKSILNSFIEYYPNYFFNNPLKSPTQTAYVIIDYPGEHPPGTFPFLRLLIELFDIRKGPFDILLNPLPYLPIDSRWIPDVGKFLSDSVILESSHQQRGIWGYSPYSPPTWPPMK